MSYDDPVVKVRDFVKAFDASLEPMRFLGSDTATVEKAASVAGILPAQVAKSLLFKAGENFGLFVAAGDMRIDHKVVKEKLGGRARMASLEEVEAMTGFQVGGVCPFALIEDVPIYIDATLKRFEMVYPAAGDASSAYPMTFDQLCAVTKGTVIDMCKLINE